VVDADYSSASMERGDLFEDFGVEQKESS